MRFLHKLLIGAPYSFCPADIRFQSMMVDNFNNVKIPPSLFILNKSGLFFCFFTWSLTVPALYSSRICLALIYSRMKLTGFLGLLLTHLAMNILLFTHVLYAFQKLNTVEDSMNVHGLAIPSNTRHDI